MAFVDKGTSRKILEGQFPMKITLAGAVVAGDPIKYDTGWKLAANTAGKPAVLIAGEDGAVGDVITAYGMAIVECAHTAANKPTEGEKIAVANTGIYAPSATALQDIGYVIGIDSDELHSQLLVCGMGVELTRPTTNLDMGGHKLTGVGAPTVEGDALSKGDAVLVGTEIAVVADANIIGGLLVLHRIDIADGAGDTDVTLTHKTRVIDAWAVKTAAVGAAGDNVTIKNGANAITDAIDIGTPAADKVLVRAGTIDDAYHEIAAAGTLRVTAAHNTNNACTVYVLGIRVA